MARSLSKHLGEELQRIIDLSNQRFGRLVVRELHSSGKQGAYWLCCCDCGKETIARAASLKNGMTKSCGCFKREISILQGRKTGKSNLGRVSSRRGNLTGLRFGRLVALTFVDSLNGHARWECVCDCGNKIITRAKTLRNGGSTSCGCFREELRNRQGVDHPNWRGGKYVTPKGYVILRIDGIPVFEHRIIMEEFLGRSLTDFEEVHHKNGIRSDNRIENLELWTVSQPKGQRPEDLVSWVLEYYRDLVIKALETDN